jgi:hypothetical protein
MALEHPNERLIDRLGKKVEQLVKKLERTEELYRSALEKNRKLQKERDALLARVNGALLGIEQANLHQGVHSAPGDDLVSWKDVKEGWYELVFRGQRMVVEVEYHPGAESLVYGVDGAGVARPRVIEARDGSWRRLADLSEKPRTYTSRHSR